MKSYKKCWALLLLSFLLDFCSSPSGTKCKMFWKFGNEPKLYAQESLFSWCVSYHYQEKRLALSCHLKAAELTGGVNVRSLLSALSCRDRGNEMSRWRAVDGLSKGMSLIGMTFSQPLSICPCWSLPVESQYVKANYINYYRLMSCWHTAYWLKESFIEDNFNWIERRKRGAVESIAKGGTQCLLPGGLRKNVHGPFSPEHISSIVPSVFVLVVEVKSQEAQRCDRGGRCPCDVWRVQSWT